MRDESHRVRAHDAFDDTHYTVLDRTRPNVESESKRKLERYEAPKYRTSNPWRQKPERLLPFPLRSRPQQDLTGAMYKNVAARATASTEKKCQGNEEKMQVAQDQGPGPESQYLLDHLS